jgi:hypothetical protein
MTVPLAGFEDGLQIVFLGDGDHLSDYGSWHGNVHFPLKEFAGLRLDIFLRDQRQLFSSPLVAHCFAAPLSLFDIALRYP